MQWRHKSKDLMPKIMKNTFFSSVLCSFFPLQWAVTFQPRIPEMWMTIQNKPLNKPNKTLSMNREVVLKFWCQNYNFKHFFRLFLAFSLLDQKELRFHMTLWSEANMGQKAIKNAFVIPKVGKIYLNLKPSPYSLLLLWNPEWHGWTLSNGSL